MDSEAVIINRQTSELASLKVVGNAQAGVLANPPMTASWSGTVPTAIPSGKNYNAQWTVRFDSNTDIDFIPFAQCCYSFSISPTFASVNGMTMSDPGAFDEMQLCQVNLDSGNGFIEWLILYADFTGVNRSLTLNVAVFSANTGSISITRDF